MALLSQLTPDEVNAFTPWAGVLLNDIWGWTSPAGEEYALIGTGDGMSVVRVTDPTSPQFIGIVPSENPNSFGNLWGDIAVFNVPTRGNDYDGYAYYTTEADDTPITILSLNQLDALGPAEPGTPGAVIEPSAEFTDGGYESAHNIYVNQDSGFAYVAGVHLAEVGSACEGDEHFPARFNTLILDLNDDPLDPSVAACVADNGEHDFYAVNYNGPDQDYRGREIAFVFDGRDRDGRTGSRPDSTPGEIVGGMTEIWDVTDKDNIEVISSFLAPGICFSHQGWTESDRHEYLLINDELDELRDLLGIGFGACDAEPQTEDANPGIYVMDIRDLDAPVFQERFEIDAPGNNDHNFVREGNKLYWAVYNVGTSIIDIRTRAGQLELREIGYLDSEPRNAPFFFGQWGIFPMQGSDTIVASDINNGLMVMEFDPEPGLGDEKGVGAGAGGGGLGRDISDIATSGPRPNEEIRDYIEERMAAGGR